MTAKNGDTVKVHYIGTLSDGTVFVSTVGKMPVELTLGKGDLIDGFNDAIVGMKPGEMKEVDVLPEKAYGERNDDFVEEMAIERFEHITGKHAEEGMVLVLKDDETGQFKNAHVKEVKSRSVILDLNNPLAGQTLHYKIKLLEIA